jgi:hypothetical protein
MEKGLFSSLFIITMILLLTPTLVISNQSHYVTDTYNYLTLATISVDNVIVDAVMDESFQSSCILKTDNDYDAEVVSYLNQFTTELNSLDHTNISCTYQDYQGTLFGVVYTGSLKLKCSQSNKFTSVTLEKELLFKKEISAIDDGAGNCTITIRDSLDGGNVVAQQVR